VDPAYQGKGYASRLLKPMLARIDRENMPCYLDTEEEKNVSIYQHFGFKVLEEVKIPSTDIILRAMLREKSRQQ
jgi:ribosomal protein S18 acetylase RimI-like enzyme